MIEGDILSNPLFMELSLFLAQVLGIVLFVLGFGFICNAGHYKKMYAAMMKDEGLLFTITVLVLVLGTVLVLKHNVWESSWVVIITIVGWIGLLKGFLLAIFPKQIVGMSSKALKSTALFRVAGAFYLILGAVLLYFGFFV